MTNPTIVCIEHSNSAAAVLVAIVEDLGFKAVVFNNGVKAARYVQENSVEMIMVNVRINGEDSLELVEELRTASADRTRIIAITSSRIPQDHSACIAAGVDALLIRPYTHRDVVDAVMNGDEQQPAQQISDETDSLAAALQPAACLDHHVLGALVRDISADSTKEALHVFVRDLQADLKSVVTGDSDNDSVAAFAHPIKSVARTFGARELARAAEDLETVSRLGGTRPELNGLLSVVNDCASRFIRSVDRLDWAKLDNPSAILGRVSS